MQTLSVRTESQYETMRELYRFRMRKAQIVAGAAGVLLCAASFRQVFRDFWPDIGTLLPYFAITLLMGLLLALLIHSGYTRRVHMRSAATVPQGWAFTFTPAGFTVQPDGGELTELRYEDLVRVTETGNLILLYNSRLSSLPVDKRAVQGGTADDLRALLKANLPAEKCRLS